MQYAKKRTFPPFSIQRLKKLITCGLIFGLILELALSLNSPARRATAQGECTVQCSAAVPTAAAVNTPVIFTTVATTTGCTSTTDVEWDFGDGSPLSTQARTSHVYAGPGTYNWQMRATATSGLTTIDTIAGGYGEGAQANRTSFTLPTVIARDPLGRGLFVADESATGNFVRFINTTADTVTLGGKKIEAGANRVLTNSTGNLNAPNTGIPTQNTFNEKAASIAINPAGLAVSNDGSLLYIGDAASSVVLAYNLSAGNQTVFGQTLNSGNVGVVASTTQEIGALAVHPISGEIYFLGPQTGTNRVYKITGLNQLQTIAGNGALTNAGQPLPPGQPLDATAVPLLNPRDIAFDGVGNLFIADTGHARIVKVDTAGKLTLVHQFQVDFNAFPSALAVRGNEVYVATGNYQIIARVAPSYAILAGQDRASCDYTASDCGDGGPAVNARFNLQNSSNTPPLTGIETDPNGLYILDQGNSLRGRIRYINQSNGEVTILGKSIKAAAIDTVAGNGLLPPYDNELAVSAVLSDPSGVAVDANGNLFIADTPRGRLRFVNRGKTIVTLFAGTAAERVVPPGQIVTINNEAASGADNNTLVNQASFDNPQGLFATAQGLFVVDSKKGPVVDGRRTGLIRFINTSATAVTLFAGFTVEPGRIATVAGGGQASGSNGDGGFALNAKFLAPSDVVVHPTLKHIYIADVGNGSVRKINGVTGNVSTLNLPESFYTGVGMDPGGRLYVADYKNGQILRETASDSGNFQKININSDVAFARDVTADASGNTFVVAGGPSLTLQRVSFRIFRVGPGGGVETVAGTSFGFDGDGGPATSAQLATTAPTLTIGGITPGPAYPQTINIAFSPVSPGNAVGELIFADTGNNRIRRVGTGMTTCLKTGTITISGNHPVPTLGKIAPSYVLLGRATTLVLNGTGFTPSSVVRWKGQDRQTTFISNTQLLAALPLSDAGVTELAQVNVFNPAPGGGTSNTLTIPVSRLNPAPGTVSLNPNTAAIGTAFTLIVNGSDFVPNSVVNWNGSPRPTTYLGQSMLQAQIPATDLQTVRDVPVTVLNPEPGGGTSTAATFRVTATNAVPTLVGLNPAVANVGVPNIGLTVVGRNFSVNSVIRWNGSNRPTTFINSTTLSTTLTTADTATAGIGNVTVFTPEPGGGTSVTLPFFIGKPASAVQASSFSSFGVAPDSIASLFGENLANGVEVAGTVPLPTSLLGTGVTVRDSAGIDRQAPLFFVSPGQINFLVPAATATGQALLIVRNGNTVAGIGAVSVPRLAPGLFTANATGQGTVAGVALRVSGGGAPVFESLSRFENGRVISVPLDLGPESDQVYLVIYGSGFRKRDLQAAATATIGGVNVPLLYAGEAPGFVGADQVNLGPLPRSLAGRGELDLVLTIENRPANTVKVTIK
ncbi:MAG TPA: PKD domain-containing protein [Blastocatellia bacterium]|nr:PKD domain-containing protein [Blastocatellia bacterium]HNG32249.1 PKD domain-containing protein [Blastocatellia bacterium]